MLTYKKNVNLVKHTFQIIFEGGTMETGQLTQLISQE
jgi:hypothetical protein